MGKFFGAVILIGFCFLAGYLVGARKLGPLEEKLTEARTVIFEQKTELVKKLDEARLRLRLAEIKESIGDARAEVMAKNYGLATENIQKAKESLNSLIGDANPDFRKQLTPIVVGLDDAQKMIAKMDPETKAKLESLRIQISEIQKKQSE